MIDGLIDPMAALFEPWTAPVEPVDRNGVLTVKADSGTTVDLNGSKPFTFEPDWLYLWPVDDRHELVESGNPPKELERFELQLVYVADSKDEEARQVRMRAVSEALDNKAHAYLELVRTNRSHHPHWQHLAGRIDADTIRNFNVRGVALRLAGYRYV